MHFDRVSMNKRYRFLLNIFPHSPEQLCWTVQKGIIGSREMVGTPLSVPHLSAQGQQKK